MVAQGPRQIDTSQAVLRPCSDLFQPKWFLEEGIGQSLHLTNALTGRLARQDSLIFDI
jgi:hypothetical protein